MQTFPKVGSQFYISFSNVSTSSITLVIVLLITALSGISLCFSFVFPIDSWWGSFHVLITHLYTFSCFVLQNYIFKLFPYLNFSYDFIKLKNFSTMLDAISLSALSFSNILAISSVCLLTFLIVCLKHVTEVSFILVAYVLCVTSRKPLPTVRLYSFIFYSKSISKFYILKFYI